MFYILGGRILHRVIFDDSRIIVIPSSNIEMDNAIMMNLLDTIRQDLGKERGRDVLSAEEMDQEVLQK
eukprot:scaffold95561_cov36-Cyclotella_meneghiniana.AAC.1